MNYYNEWEKFPAQWLRELANDGLIPEGVVDERSIADLGHEDLAGYNQCHFFAGIGGWPRAIELAGIPADFPIWSGSCPCQPFSSAGKRAGAADERNLWHIWFELIRVCRPNVVVGEQVASAIAVGWLDRVLDDLESAGYETWACVLPACSVGAPHIRSRLFLAGVRRLGNADGQQAHSAIEGQSMSCAGLPAGGVADAQGSDGEILIRQRRSRPSIPESGGASRACGLADAEDADRGRGECGTEAGTWPDGERGRGFTGSSSACRLGDSQQPRLERHAGNERDWDEPGRIGAGAPGSTPATGHWSDAVAILCRDGKTRRVPEPQSGIFGLVAGLPESLDLGWIESSFPLAGKVPGRVGLLRGYGNAIAPQVAAAFLRAVLQ